MTTHKAFYAYSSQPVLIAETVTAALEEINNAGDVEVTGWESLSTTGKFIIETILQAIDGAHVFCADLTTLNPNVLFETGYAIAKGRRTWFSFNNTKNDYLRDSRAFSLLKTVGYAPYENKYALANHFNTDRPYESLEETLFDSQIRNQITEGPGIGVFYLMSSTNTDASIKLTRLLTRPELLLTIDDPRETTTQSLSWYVKNSSASLAVVAHFVAQDSNDHRIHNAKMAFISGLSVGLGKKVLMLAPEPYETPIDYHDLLQSYNKLSQCENAAGIFIENILKQQHKDTLVKKKYVAVQTARTELQSLSFGDHEAEREEEQLNEYFVDTPIFSKALSARNAIYVGRKGTGKTAMLIQIASQLRDDKRCFVCELRPIDYEIKGVVELLSSISSESAKGFLIESLWKFLLYSELAFKYYRSLEQRPEYYTPTTEEDNFLEFARGHDFLMTDSFSLRLDTAIKILKDRLKASGKNFDARLKISEALHSEFLNKLRFHLGLVLTDKDRVAFLVDNLDKAWVHGDNISLYCEFLNGLLNVIDPITLDFQTESQWKKKVNFSLIVFLRSDIFEVLKAAAHEPDKMGCTNLIWGDRELLIRLIEERFVASSSVDIPAPDQLWNKYIDRDVHGIPVKDFVFSKTMPRPRDAVFLFNDALDTAVNRGHTRIQAEDLEEALEGYSTHAFNSLLVESPTGRQQMEEILFEFLGSECVLSQEEVFRRIAAAGVPREEQQDILEKLFDLCFLGLETAEGVFVFNYREDQRKRNIALGRRYAEQCDNHVGYRINEPFWKYLEIICPPD